MLHDPRQITEPDVDELDVVVAYEREDFVWAGEHATSECGVGGMNATNERLPAGISSVSAVLRGHASRPDDGGPGESIVQPATVLVHHHSRNQQEKQDRAHHNARQRDTSGPVDPHHPEAEEVHSE